MLVSHCDNSMDQEVDAVLNIVEARLQSIREVDEVSGEEGEVLLREGES